MHALKIQPDFAEVTPGLKAEKPKVRIIQLASEIRLNPWSINGLRAQQSHICYWITVSAVPVPLMFSALAD